MEHYRLVPAPLTALVRPACPRAACGLAACVLAACVLAVGGGAWLARRVSRVEVDGDSMRPTLLPGDRLIVVRGRRPRAGDLVTMPDPRDPRRVVVKRVARIDGPVDGPVGRRQTVVVRGDNPGVSTDSRTFGPVPAGSIRGRVVYRYFPDDRRGSPQRER